MNQTQHHYNSTMAQQLSAATTIVRCVIKELAGVYGTSLEEHFDKLPINVSGIVRDTEPRYNNGRLFLPVHTFLNVLDGYKAINTLGRGAVWKLRETLEGTVREIMLDYQQRYDNLAPP